MSARTANLVLALGLVTLFLLVTLTSPRWAGLFRRPVIQGVDGAPITPAAGAPEPNGDEDARRRISVKLFFEAADRPGLVLEERSIPFAPDLAAQLRIVIEELARGSQTGLGACVNPKTRVLDAFVTSRGIAYVDLSKEIAEESPSGSEAELLTVYSIVNSITVNFPAIRAVQILVDDRQALTLAGHVDLSRPLFPNMALLAVSTLSPRDAPPEVPASPPASP